MNYAIEILEDALMDEERYLRHRPSREMKGVYESNIDDLKTAINNLKILDKYKS